MNKLVIPILLLLSIGIKAYAQPKIDSITILTGGEGPYNVANSVPYGTGPDTTSILEERTFVALNRRLTLKQRNSKLYSSLTTIFNKIIDGKFARVGVLTHKKYDYDYTNEKFITYTSERFEFFSDSLLINLLDTTNSIKKYYTTRIVIHRANNFRNDTLLYNIDLLLRYKNKVYLNKEIIMFYLELRKEMVEQCVKEQNKLDEALYRKLKAWADKGEYPKITRKDFYFSRKYNFHVYGINNSTRICSCWLSGHLPSQSEIKKAWCPIYPTLNKFFSYEDIKILFKKYLDMRILSDLGL